MKTPTYIAISKQTGMMREMDSIANNLANVSTTGFRSKHKLFQEYLEKTGKLGPQDRISFVQDVGDYRNNKFGKLQTTNRGFDLAIQGEGYFVLGSPSSNFYTRNGAFALDDKNQLVTSEGFPVLQEGDVPVVVPANSSISIGLDGSITATEIGSGNATSTTIGRLKLVKFDDDQALRDAGAAEYTTDQEPKPANGIIRQGMLESSNVEPITEITHMITVQRSYEMSSSLVKSEDSRERAMLEKLLKSV
ncbi:MAG: flagellar basal-body rod protein FlgF [Alphaproteobacteria bacterium]|nr:flagellar basal-body rod protein FlgF [Alphaproteobacteria bacterium]